MQHVKKDSFTYEKTLKDQRKKNIKPSTKFIEEFDQYLQTLKEITL